MPENFNVIEKYVDMQVFFRCPVEIYDQLISFMKKKKYKSRNSAITDLLQIAMIVMQRIDTLKDPELVAELKAQAKEAALVEYFQHLNHSDFYALKRIIDVETIAREKGYVLK